jgi:hypothetical protein
MHEEMLHGKRQKAERAMAAEDSAVVIEALDRDRFVEWAPLGTTDEGHDGAGF